MNTKMTNTMHRQRAREVLTTQWGKMAWITFLAYIFTGIAKMILEDLLGFTSESTGSGLLSFILENFVFFAITYGTYYCALQVLRGTKVSVEMLGTVFKNGFYQPMFLINIIQYVLEFIIGLLLFLPFLFLVGPSIYMSLLLNQYSFLPQFTSEVATFSFIGYLGLVLLVFLFLVFFLSMFISGIFQFAVWTKFDQPTLSLKEVLKEAFSLMKGRFAQYVWLQLSFVGWYILSIITIIGLCWVIPYKNVAIASFYEAAKEEIDGQ